MVRPTCFLLGFGGKKKSIQSTNRFFKNSRFKLEALEDRTAPAVAIAYVNEAWTGLDNGSSIADADPTIAGDQSAIIGTDAFAGLDGGADAVESGGTVTLLPGTYANNVTMTNPFFLNVLPGHATISGNISGATALQIGKDGHSGDGTLTLSGVNTYAGATFVSSGHLQISSDSQLGAPLGLSFNSGYLSVTAPGSVEITNTMTTSRVIFLNNNAMLKVDGGQVLALSGAEIDGGTLAGPGTIETIDQLPTNFNGVRSSSSLILNAKSDTNFTAFDNGGAIDLAATKTFALNSFTNTSLGTMFVNGTANVADFATNGQLTVGPTGKIVNVGSSGLTFGGGSNTTVNRLGSGDMIDNGLIDLGNVSADLTGGLMTNHGVVGSNTPGVSLVVAFGGNATGTGVYVSLLTFGGGVYSPGNGTGNNEAVISGAIGGRVQQNTTLIVSGLLTVADPDPGESHFQADAALTAYGSYTLSSFGDWVYTLNNNGPAVQALAPGNTLTDSFTAVSLDGTRRLVIITVIDESADPVIHTVISGDTQGSIQVGGAVIVSGTLTVTDPDPGESSFQAAAGLTPYGSYTVTTGGNWVYTVNKDSPALLQALVHSLHISEGFTILSFDGDTKTVAITITGFNDAPIFTQSNYHMALAVNAAPQIIGSVHANNTDSTEYFQTVAYAITAGNDIGLFAIDASTGAITANGQDCCGTLNLGQEFELIVSATDNGNPIQSSNSTVSVIINSSVG